MPIPEPDSISNLLANQVLRIDAIESGLPLAPEQRVAALHRELTALAQLCLETSETLVLLHEAELIRLKTSIEISED